MMPGMCRGITMRRTGMPANRIGWIVLAAVLVFGVVLLPLGSAQQPAQARMRALTPQSADVRADGSCGSGACSSSSLTDSNRTRKLAVSPTGVISALFWNTSGIWVASSSNRGASFGAPKRVTTAAVQGEIGIGSDGTLFVNWNDGGNLNISKSTNGGSTWSAPIRVASGIASNYFRQVQSVHMAIDGEYLYLLPQTGTKVYISSNAGTTWTEKTVSPISMVFSDIHVDPLTHTLYAFLDNPTVYWHSSTDRGMTWSAAKTTGKYVSYSVGALSSSAGQAFFYMAGSEAKLERFTLTGTTVETKTVAGSDLNTRSLAADSCGNVVSGNKTGPDLFLQYSTDSGTTFSSAEKVVSGAERANASINQTNGDVLYLYEKSGHIYLTTYAGLLGGTGGCYALTLSRTAVELGYAGDTQSVTLTNTSASPLTINTISMSGTAFTQTTTCAGSIAAGASCTVTISGSTAASELLTLDIGSVVKTVPVSLGAMASVRPTATATRVPTATRVVKKKQTITFPAITNKKIGTKEYILTATASSGLTVAYSTKTPKICTVSGSTVKLLKIGTCTITASQAGGSGYLAAPPVSKSFKITK